MFLFGDGMGGGMIPTLLQERRLNDCCRKYWMVTRYLDMTILSGHVEP